MGVCVRVTEVSIPCNRNTVKLTHFVLDNHKLQLSHYISPLASFLLFPRLCFHLPASAPQPRLSLASILIIGLSFDLLPQHPTYLMIEWLIIPPTPWGEEHRHCQQIFLRLRYIFIVLAPWSFRTVPICVKTKTKFKELSVVWVLLHWCQFCTQGFSAWCITMQFIFKYTTLLKMKTLHLKNRNVFILIQTLQL